MSSLAKNAHKKVNFIVVVASLGVFPSRGLYGTVRHAESESDVQNNQTSQPEPKTLEKLTFKTSSVRGLVVFLY